MPEPRLARSGNREEVPVTGTRLRQFKAVIAAWSRKDVEAVLEAMHEDIVWHFAAAIAPPARGKAEARAFIDRFGSGIAEVRWRIFAAAEDEDRLFLEGVDEYTTVDGVDVAAPYAGVIEFEGDLIIGWRDYVDRGTIETMKSGGGYPSQVLDLMSRPSL
jgi:limonene-1,2-epoxide hydrolase